MNMTSRYSLLAGVAGLIWAGCSAPAEEVEDAPTLPPPGYTNAAGTTGNQPVASAGAGGTAPITPPPAAGAGGTAPVAAGGSAGAPVASGGAGGGGGAAPADVPIGTGLALIPQADGWIPGASNGLGIQGAFFAASDADANATGTTLEFDTATTPGTVCASGSLAAVVDADFETYWGGSVGLNLHQVIPPTGGDALPASAWSRATPAGNVTGFSYTITANGGTPLPNLRFTVDYVGKAAADTYCRDAIQASTSTQFSQVIQSCWTAGGAVLPAADLLSIQFSIVSGDAPVPFDFCISNLQAVVQ